MEVSSCVLEAFSAGSVFAWLVPGCVNLECMAVPGVSGNRRPFCMLSTALDSGFQDSSVLLHHGVCSH